MRRRPYQVRKQPCIGFCGKRMYAVAPAEIHGSGRRINWIKRQLVVGRKALQRYVLPVVKSVGAEVLPVAGHVAGQAIEKKTGYPLAGNALSEASKLGAKHLKSNKELSPIQLQASNFIASRSKAKLSQLGKGNRVIGTGNRVIGTGNRVIGTGNRVIGTGYQNVISE